MLKKTDTLLAKNPAKDDERTGLITLLKEFGLSFHSDDYYIYVNEPTDSQGWILHVSVIASQYKNLLNKLLPEFILFNLAFKLIKSGDFLSKINDGLWGIEHIGKAITVYIQPGSPVDKLVPKLLEKCKGFFGPLIATDYRIGHNLYYRYGAFKPIIKTDSYGRKYKLILNDKDTLIIDQNSNPPFLPDWIPNPFLQYSYQETVSKAAKMFFKRFKIIHPIKVDKKGNVYKGLYWKYGFIPIRCLIKEARIGFFSGEDGEDVRNRLIWQFNLFNRLSPIISVPKTFGILTEEERILMAVSWIYGKSVNKKSFDILRNRQWFLLNSKSQKRIICYLLQIANAIDKIHNEGLIHGDITGTNFMVSSLDKVLLIDFELTYDYLNSLPETPYKGGTPGYMSPEFQEKGKPSYSDDIYSFGALMISSLTGIEPKLVIESSRTILSRKLYYFLQDNDLVNIICRCLSSDPEYRPSIKEIILFLQNFNPQMITQKQTALSDRVIKSTVQSSIFSLGSNLMTCDNLWFSSTKDQFDPKLHLSPNKEYQWNLYNGAAGPLYVLFEAAALGFDISSAYCNMQNALDYLEKIALSNIKMLSPGLYYGSTGIAVLLAKAIKAGFISAEKKYIEAIKNCFNKENSFLNILYGLAGDGIALLHCEAFLNKNEYNYLLGRIISKLINCQESDGSWIELADGGYPEKRSGFGYGVAGIAYFLIKAGVKCSDQNAINSGEKALAYLIKQSIRKRDSLTWKISDKDSTRGIWWCNGSLGVALSLLKCYEIMRNPVYYNYANLALLTHPERPVTYQISYCHGITGVGDIYLEAYRITGDIKWLERAQSIAEYLSISKFSVSDTSGFWMVEWPYFPTAGLMTGNSGILYFLLRYLKLESVSSLMV